MGYISKFERLRRAASHATAQQLVDDAIAKSLVVKPGEWIEIGHVAVRTKSLLEASRIAVQVKTTRQVGTIDGVEFMDLGIFRDVLQSQRVAAQALRSQLLEEERAESLERFKRAHPARERAGR